VAWSGALLGAECERWGATRDPAALDRVRTLLEGLHVLTAVTGERGLWARYACPRAEEHREPWPADWHDGGPGWEDWRWRGDLSKDQVAGLVYGLAAVQDLVEDPFARARSARMLGDLADRLLGRGGIYEDAGGRPTTYGDVRPSAWGLPVGVNAAVALGVAEAAARATGEPRHARFLAGLLEAGACASLRVPTIRVLGKENFNNPNMVAMALASVLRRPPPPGDAARARLRAAAEGSMARILELHRGEANAFWTAVAAPAGEAAGVTPRDLRDARAAVVLYGDDLRGRPVDHSARTDLPRATFASKRGRAQFSVPLPPDERGAGSFVWKSNPFEVVQDPGGPGGAVYSGADFLVAYWPLRRLGHLP
jgi:hypothetical protein